MLRVIQRFSYALATFVGFVASVTVVTLVTFWLAINAFAANISGPPGLAVTADFSTDGYPDLAVLKYNSTKGITTLAIFTSNAIGTLSLAHAYGVFNFDGSRDIVAADVNDDGKIDLIVSDDLGGSILLGTGDAAASFVAARVLTA